MSKALMVLIGIIVAIVIGGYFIYQSLVPSEMQQQTEDLNQQEVIEAPAESGYMDVTVQEAKILIESNPELIVIDVSPNYTEGHLPGAINYYLGDGSLDRAIPNLDKNIEYLVYCHVDSVAILGAQKLINAGIKKVYRLEGNYVAWIEAGYPVDL